MSFWHRNIDAHEIIICIKGALKWETEMGTKVMRSGDMLFIPKGIAHRSMLCDESADENVLVGLKLADDLESRIDKARAKGMDGVVDTTIERWFTPETVGKNPPVLEKVCEMIRTTSSIGHEGCYEALKTLSFGARIANIHVPTLIVGGAKDKGAPPEILAEAASKIPGAEHVVVPDAGHIVALENPAAFLSELRKFPSGVDSKKTSHRDRCDVSHHMRHFCV
jgi:hypothetical protein